MKLRLNIAVIALFVLAVWGCKKETPYAVSVAPAAVHFSSTTQYLNYYVTSAATDSFAITVGTTDVADGNRTVNFSISSPTGATSGNQYTVINPASGNTVTIPAGKATASIVLHGNFASYSTGRKDTLVVALAQGSVPLATYFLDTVKVILQRYCPVNLNSFLGNYANTYDIDNTGTYGPYTSVVTSVTPITSTTASMTISNFSFEEVSPYPISTITVTLDYTDPGNFKITIPNQTLSNSNFYGYGVLSTKAAGTSSFSSCDNTFTLNYSLNVSAGTFGNFKTVMAR